MGPFSGFGRPERRWGTAALGHCMAKDGLQRAIDRATDKSAREFFSPAFKVGAAGYGIAPEQKVGSYLLGGQGGLAGLSDWWNPLSWGKTDEQLTHSTRDTSSTRVVGETRDRAAVASEDSLGPSSSSPIDLFWKDGKPTDLGIGAAVVTGLVVLATTTGVLGRTLRKR